MSSTFSPSAIEPGKARSLRRRFPWSTRRAFTDTLYLISGFALALGWWVLLVALIATGTSLVVTLVGLPILAATLYLWTRIADTERWRARMLLGLDVGSPYQPVGTDARSTESLLHRVFAPRVVWERIQDVAVWRDLAYLLVVFFPLSMATFVVTVTIWGTGLMLVAQPFVFWTGGGIELWNDWKVDTFGASLPFFAAGVVVLALVPLVLRVLVGAHAFTVRSLLGTRTALVVGALTRQRQEAVDAAVAERRRIERDLHDGAQQRLTAVAIDLGRARAKMDSDPDAARVLVEQAHEDAKHALAELRNLARGIHPAILTDRGLDAALSALAAKSSVPVEIAVELETRPSVAIESTAYFVVAEAIANASKHAAATHVRVDIRRSGNTLVIEIADDGVGGARLESSGGLEGLTTRVATLGGTLAVSSPAGGPTRVRAELPCAS